MPRGEYKNKRRLVDGEGGVVGLNDPSPELVFAGGVDEVRLDRGGRHVEERLELVPGERVADEGDMFVGDEAEEGGRAERGEVAVVRAPPPEEEVPHRRRHHTAIQPLPCSSVSSAVSHNRGVDISQAA
ncbi:hypothetical protein SASPL_130907 [Salvia splendens]|nr:hypothetical protein SASPL_130907 [Salvia splendens]